MPSTKQRQERARLFAPRNMTMLGLRIPKHLKRCLRRRANDAGTTMQEELASILERACDAKFNKNNS